MLIRKLRVSILAFFVLAVLLSSRCVRAKKVLFKLGGEAGSAMAIITKTELDLIVDVGKRKNYPDLKKFTLTIGGCAVDIEARASGEDIDYKLKAEGKNRGTVSNLKAIIATSQKIHFTDNAAIHVNVGGCSVNFGERRSDGSYHVNVKLSGDDVPSALQLTSKEAKMEEKELASSDSSGVKIELIVGVSIGAAIIVLLILSIIVFVCYCCCKEKATREEQERCLAAKKREAAKVPEPTVKPVEEKKAYTDTKSETKSSSESIHRPKVRPKGSLTVVKPKETPKANPRAKSITTTENHKTVTSEYQSPVRMHTQNKDSKIIQLDCDVSAEAAN